MDKEKKGKIIKITVTSIIAILFVWFFFVYPLGYFHKNEKTLKKAAEHYFEVNYQELPQKDEVTTLSLSELAKEKYVEDLYVPYTKNTCSIDDSWVKVRKEGDGYQYYVYLKCGYLSSAVDHTGPEITLKGDQEVVLDKGQAYDEKGVKSVYDKADKELKTEEVIIKNDTVNTSKLGTYKVTYTAYDSLDNKTTVERTVKVVQKLSGVVRKDTGKQGYYIGSAAQNYIKLSGMLFRIFGINNDGSVRIVAAEDVAHLDYDGIQKWLDNYYYSHLTEEAKKFLVDSTFCSDRLSTTDLTTTECSSNQKTKKVGILSAEDYAKTIIDGESYLYSDTIVWLANDKNDKEAWTSRNWFDGEDSKYKAFNKKNNFVVHPVLTIKKDTLIKGGNGSPSNPYTLGDLKPAKANDKLNTRVTGEYVTYGGNTFRIIETTTDGTTKVIAQDVLRSEGEDVEVEDANRSDVQIYNPKKKGNIGYMIENETPSYIKTDIFVKHEIEVPIYKDYALYGKADSIKKYKVKFSAPSMQEMFSGSNNELIFSSYWLRDSSKTAKRKFLVSQIGNIYEIKLESIYTSGVRVVGHIHKDVTILDGKGTEKDPYTLVK